MFCGWSGEKWKDHFEKGNYKCTKCGSILFTSEAKYQHNSPWPAFQEAAGVKRLYQDGGNAWKVGCKECEQPLGHEFVGDGPGDAADGESSATPSTSRVWGRRSRRSNDGLAAARLPSA
eukprot:CAMPEP_0182853462 /NCGR_PEP_ID=MMETSP0034_2-20130328/713_1 /TAXON_ID=156128 /ORGANISM="Nephroselmis pyriformis, Strain CCMP717" /LENGTH=118 /DNA_ID=CAMNT_0024984233 /DNA_START=35 /DNA_END=388 /DNA_ORIENTATION=+